MTLQEAYDDVMNAVPLGIDPRYGKPAMDYVAEDDYAETLKIAEDLQKQGYVEIIKTNEVLKPYAQHGLILLIKRDAIPSEITLPLITKIGNILTQMDALYTSRDANGNDVVVLTKIIYNRKSYM